MLYQHSKRTSVQWLSMFFCVWSLNWVIQFLFILSSFWCLHSCGDLIARGSFTLISFEYLSNINSQVMVICLYFVHLKQNCNFVWTMDVYKLLVWYEVLTYFNLFWTFDTWRSLSFLITWFVKSTCTGEVGIKISHGSTDFFSWKFRVELFHGLDIVSVYMTHTWYCFMYMLYWLLLWLYCKQSQANIIHFNWCNTFDFFTLKFTRAILQVLIRYGKYSNATLMLDFGFALPYNIHDQVSYGNLDWRKLLTQWRTMVIV